MGEQARRGDPLDIAVRALEHRDRSAADVDARLARAGFGDEERREMLDSLERLGYLDDGRFGRSRAQALAGRGYGDSAIRADLAEQGLAEDVVEEALAELEPERERARVIVERRGSGVQTARYLARKGFGEGSLEQAIAQEP